MNKRGILNLIVVGVLMGFPMSLCAQTNVLHREFEFSATSPMNDDEDFDYETCWSIENGNLQVGSSKGPTGSIETKSPLNLNGNATLVLKVKVNTGTAKYRVSITGGGTVDYDEYTLDENSFRYDAILIRDGTPYTKIKIEGIEGYFDLGAIEVVSIGDGYFRESFGKMVSGSNTEFGLNSNERYAPISKCDNQIGASFSDIVVQSEGCIYLLGGSYKTPPFGVPSGSMALLSFRYARSNQMNVKLTVTGASEMAALNSTNFSNSISIMGSSLPRDYVWSDCFVLVNNVDRDTRFTFSGESVFLDDVELTPYVILDEAADNSSVILNNRGRCWVTLIRTLGAGYWNTLCLPFDITQNELADVAGEGANPEICTLTSASDGEFCFGKVDADATIEAGTPFIVRVANDVVKPQFRNVLVKNVDAKAEGAGGYQFVGTYSPVDLKTDKTNYFLGKDGLLKYPSATDNKMNGLRAYFVTPANGGSSRVSVDGEELAAIGAIDADVRSDAPVYDLRGQRHDAESLSKGIYIRDGRKVIIR